MVPQQLQLEWGIAPVGVDVGFKSCGATALMRSLKMMQFGTQCVSPNSDYD
ncbi:hypothetical protein QUB12_24760 [Microcoleus sp. B7-D4]